MKAKAVKKIVYEYLISNMEQNTTKLFTHKGTVEGINEELNTKDQITIPQLRRALHGLNSSMKIATTKDRRGVYITLFSVGIELKNEQAETNSLFVKELSAIDWAVVKVIEEHCVGPETSWHFGYWIVDKVNSNLKYEAIKSVKDLRIKHLLNIKKSLVYTRVIRSNPNYGYGIPLYEDRNKISHSMSKILNSIENELINEGAHKINLIYNHLNDLRGKHTKIDNNGRLVFNTEKDHIRLYGDDLLKAKEQRISDNKEKHCYNCIYLREVFDTVRNDEGLFDRVLDDVACDCPDKDDLVQKPCEHFKSALEEL